jgi:3-phenylpropionate/trans-cinnamate dioxygenase ferredoxin reductase subunit
MSNLHVKYLLVGGGLVSSSAAGAIRELDSDGSILLVGQEINRPYHRPPLSKEYLRRQQSRAELTTQPVGWFAEHGIELRTGRRVAHLDTPRQTAALDSGEEVTYDRLLLATGAVPAPLDVPGAALPNVFHLRTIEDADRLHNAVDKAKREGRLHADGKGGRGRATVIGAGLLGVELAGSLTQLGIAVDLVSTSHPWDRFAGETTGRFVTAYLQSRGVTVHAPARPARLEGDGRVQRVVLGGEGPGSPDCDFAIACVGAMANKELVRNTPIGAGRAILVDDHCRTNVPNVFAAGDCAALLDPLFGKHRVLDHWDNALATGRLAGRNMAGADEAYSGVNRFATRVFELSVTVWGEARLVDRRLVRGTPRVEAPAFAEVGVAADGRVAQVIAVGEVVEAELLRELVGRRFAVDGNEEALKDPQAGLAALLA